MALADAPRLVVTSFPPGAEPQASTEWVVAAGDRRVGFWTPDVTAWVARLSACDVVTVRAANQFGAVDREAPLLEGRAEVVTDGEVLELVRAATRAKYGLGAGVAGIVDRIKELGTDKTPEGAIVIDVVG